jgi:integrase
VRSSTRQPDARRQIRTVRPRRGPTDCTRTSCCFSRLVCGRDTGLVFTTSLGTKLDQDNIRRDFRRITKAAGLGEGWVPRELRHTFVSIMSAGGVPVEEIARVAGHKQTSTTELVYRRELRPVITAGAEVMDTVSLSQA